MTDLNSDKPTQAGEVFQPRIAAFVCNWCTYAGADLAGTSRLQYPPNVRIIKLPCTGRIDPLFILKAFEGGADAALVSGCHPGDCHYTSGNFHARRRWAVFRRLLDLTGIGDDRLFFSWVSAAEGGKFAALIGEITERVRRAGPFEPANPARRRWETVPFSRRLRKGDCPPCSKGDSPPASKPVDRAACSPKEEGGQSPFPKTNSEKGTVPGDAAALLADGKVKLVLGYRAVGLRRVPAMILAPAAAAELVYDAQCKQNLASYLAKPEIAALAPLAIVASPDTLRSLIVLSAESQISADKLVILPVDGESYIGPTDLRQAAAALKRKERDERVTGRLKELMAMTPAARAAFWADEFARCTRCYACRANCPACYCKRCVVEKNQPQWISTAARSHGNYAWQIIRAFHAAGRCVGCGACEAACPQAIPLMLLNAFVAAQVEEEFGYRPGADPDAKPFIGSFRPEDKQEFIR